MSETTETETSTPSFLAGGNRRRFLAGVGVAGAALAFAACSDDDGDESTGGGDTTEGDETTTTAGDDTTTTAGDDTTTTAAPGGGEVDETAIAMLAAGLEVLAVDTYTAAADAATAGDLGEVPPAVVEYVTTALAHHEEHLASWNEVLTGGGNEEVTEPNADLKPTVDDAFGQVTDVTGAATLALMLEQIAAQTYLDAASQLTTPEAIELASSIYIIDMQHSALLLFAAGEYPVPDVFGKTEMSAAK